MSVPAVLLALRKTRQLTQSGFAERLGVPKSTYVSWERGEAEPPFRIAELVREAFGNRAVVGLFELLEEPELLSSTVDWPSFARLCVEAEAILGRIGHSHDISAIVELAALVFERGEDQWEQALNDLEHILRIAGGSAPTAKE